MLSLGLLLSILVTTCQPQAVPPSSRAPSFSLGTGLALPPYDQLFPYGTGFLRSSETFVADSSLNPLDVLLESSSRSQPGDTQSRFGEAHPHVTFTRGDLHGYVTDTFGELPSTTGTGGFPVYDANTGLEMTRGSLNNNNVIFIGFRGQANQDRRLRSLGSEDSGRLDRWIWYSPPPEDGYIGGYGGRDGLPVQGGYCGGPECADGGVREGLANGRPGEGSATATDLRQRTGTEDYPLTWYEIFAEGPSDVASHRVRGNSSPRTRNVSVPSAGSRSVERSREVIPGLIMSGSELRRPTPSFSRMPFGTERFLWL